MRALRVTPHVAAEAQGLTEFFPPKALDAKDNHGAHARMARGTISFDDTVIGRSWKARDLRQKSFEDLHKLWWERIKI